MNNRKPDIQANMYVRKVIRNHDDSEDSLEQLEYVPIISIRKDHVNDQREIPVCNRVSYDPCMYNQSIPKPSIRNNSYVMQPNVQSSRSKIKFCEQRDGGIEKSESTYDKLITELLSVKEDSVNLIGALSNYSQNQDFIKNCTFDECANLRQTAEKLLTATERIRSVVSAQQRPPQCQPCYPNSAIACVMSSAQFHPPKVSCENIIEPTVLYSQPINCADPRIYENNFNPSRENINDRIHEMNESVNFERKLSAFKQGIVSKEMNDMKGQIKELHETVKKLTELNNFDEFKTRNTMVNQSNHSMYSNQGTPINVTRKRMSINPMNEFGSENSDLKNLLRICHNRKTAQIQEEDNLNLGEFHRLIKPGGRRDRYITNYTDEKTTQVSDGIVKDTRETNRGKTSIHFGETGYKAYDTQKTVINEQKTPNDNCKIPENIVNTVNRSKIDYTFDNRNECQRSTASGVVKRKVCTFQGDYPVNVMSEKNLIEETNVVNDCGYSSQCNKNITRTEEFKAEATGPLRNTTTNIISMKQIREPNTPTEINSTLSSSEGDDIRTPYRGTSATAVKCNSSIIRSNVNFITPSVITGCIFKPHPPGGLVSLDAPPKFRCFGNEHFEPKTIKLDDYLPEKDLTVVVPNVVSSEPIITYKNSGTDRMSINDIIDLVSKRSTSTQYEFSTDEPVKEQIVPPPEMISRGVGVNPRDFRAPKIPGKTSRVTAKKNVGKRMKGGSDKLDEFFMGDMNSTSDPNDTDTVKRAISNDELPSNVIPHFANPYLTDSSQYKYSDNENVEAVQWLKSNNFKSRYPMKINNLWSDENAIQLKKRTAELGILSHDECNCLATLRRNKSFIQDSTDFTSESTDDNNKCNRTSNSSSCLNVSSNSSPIEVNRNYKNSAKRKVQNVVNSRGPMILDSSSSSTHDDVCCRRTGLFYEVSFEKSEEEVVEQQQQQQSDSYSSYNNYYNSHDIDDIRSSSLSETLLEDELPNGVVTFVDEDEKYTEFVGSMQHIFNGSNLIYKRKSPIKYNQMYRPLDNEREIAESHIVNLIRKRQELLQSFMSTGQGDENGWTDNSYDNIKYTKSYYYLKLWKMIKRLTESRKLEDILLTVTPEYVVFDPDSNVYDNAFRIDVIDIDAIQTLGFFWLTARDYYEAKQSGIFDDIYTVFLITVEDDLITNHVTDVDIQYISSSRDVSTMSECETKDDDGRKKSQGLSELFKDFYTFWTKDSSRRGLQLADSCQEYDRTCSNPSSFITNTVAPFLDDTIFRLVDSVLMSVEYFLGNMITRDSSNYNHED